MGPEVWRDHVLQETGRRVRWPGFFDDFVRSWWVRLKRWTVVADYLIRILDWSGNFRIDSNFCCWCLMRFPGWLVNFWLGLRAWVEQKWMLRKTSFYKFTSVKVFKNWSIALINFLTRMFQLDLYFHLLTLKLIEMMMRFQFIVCFEIGILKMTFYLTLSTRSDVQTKKNTLLNDVLFTQKKRRSSLFSHFVV